MTVLVEVVGAGWHNAGAALMLEAVRRQLRTHRMDTAVHYRVGSFRERKQHDLWHLADVWDQGRFGSVAPIFRSTVESIPKGIRARSLRLTTRRGVTAVLDASGFAFSDQRGPARTALLYWLVESWRPRGVRFILLPQAFGPFTDPRIKTMMATIVEGADLIFARDAVSLNYLVEAFGERPNIRQSPDFTNLLNAVPADSGPQNGVVLVPNMRMLDKTRDEVAANYLSFMQRCALRAMRHGLEPTVLVHEDDDPPLARQLADLIGNVRVLYERDPLRAKWLLGEARLVIGSRFHALVGSLSQGVPTVGTSWSHKYRALFEDYGCAEYLFDPATEMDAAEQSVDRLLSEPTRSTVVRHLKTAAEQQKVLTRAMWDEVITKLGSIPKATRVCAG